MTIKKIDISTVIKDFSNIVKINFTPLKEYITEVTNVINACSASYRTPIERRKECINAINHKFDLNKAYIKSFIDYAAKKKVYFNYHEKKSIKSFFDYDDKSGFKAWINSKFSKSNEIDDYVSHFTPLSSEESIKQLHEIIKETGKEDDILHALFAAYIFNVFDTKDIQKFFSNETEKTEYFENYYEYLHSNFGSTLKREKALSFLVINDSLIDSTKDINEFKDSVCSYIREAYMSLSNHCYLSIYIDLSEQHKSLKWELFSEIVLYAEKFIEEELNKGYFHPQKIKEKTEKYIPELKDGKFNIANGGFTYKDCFILSENDIKQSKQTEFNDNYGLLLLFEKNERDETLIPCPACRSKNVRGNSYPVIGVKSWECNNILCPDKSKFNRGKRYSLASLVKQEAIFYPENEITNGTIRNWQLDVVKKVSKDEILEFLVKHYTLVNDTIEIIDYKPKVDKLYNRLFIFQPFKVLKDDSLGHFFNSSYFKRFIYKKSYADIDLKNILQFNGHKILNGDCNQILSNLKAETIDSAITSPPYYNAKEYSQWDNIYCYLYDMLNNAHQVYKTLKPGGVYLYNIFDYFDNENNIVFSAMGKKRMILGAYIIHLFKHVGFHLKSNIIWYKGHIQGNRSFNQGNTFPYYQAPLNCYEHVFVFEKPSEEDSKYSFPDIIHVKPVHKMVNGVNRLGHTAPFPKGLPNILTRQLSSDEIILDPYAGSFTTARTAMMSKPKSISIELSDEYCDLGIKLMEKEASQIHFEL